MSLCSWHVWGSGVWGACWFYTGFMWAVSSLERVKLPIHIWVVVRWIKSTTHHGFYILLCSLWPFMAKYDETRKDVALTSCLLHSVTWSLMNVIGVTRIFLSKDDSYFLTWSQPIISLTARTKHPYLFIYLGTRTKPSLSWDRNYVHCFS